MSKQLYFIAIIPSREIANKVTCFKQYAAQNFRSAHALKSPPHITLIPPFRINQVEYQLLQSSLPVWLQSIMSFEIELRNFDSFSPRVIFIDMIPNEHLTRLQGALKILFQEQFGFQPDRHDKYHPHMTIAFKDLNKKMFYQAWSYFSQLEFKASFQATGITLLKYETGRWKVLSEVKFPS